LHRDQGRRKTIKIKDLRAERSAWTAMLTTPIHPVRWSLVGLLSLATLGCASQAQFTTLRPARADVSAVRRVAVLKFTGPGDAGTIARGTIVSRLRENGYYDLADPEALPRCAPAPLYAADSQLDVSAALEAARRLGLDAILLGRVRYQRDNGHALGGVTIRVGDPTTAAEVEFEFLDVRTGRRLVKDAARRSYTGELTSDKTGSTSETKVLARLVRESAAEVAERIAPHQSAVEVPLAVAPFSRGATAILAGNKLAAQGDWAAAEERWRAALVANPDSDAARYNLGVAHEARQQFDRARELYAAAHQIKSHTLYERAIERVDRAAREQQLALAQIQRAGQGASFIANAEPPPARNPRAAPGIAEYHPGLRPLPPVVPEPQLPRGVESAAGVPYPATDARTPWPYR
jgi:tetratricopeptide (TPR) repeat protein